MPLELSQFDVMEYLWDTLEKTPDGAHLRYTMLDIEQLWWMGFVDTKRYGMNEWKAVFEPYRQADGSFRLNRDQFMALDGYRYTGEIRVPFDAMQINEGWYTDEGLDDLIDASIAPSCGLPKDALQEFFDSLKKDFRGKDGLILIRKPAKQRIRALLDVHPSPLRNLELIFDQMLEIAGAEIAGKVGQAAADTATIEAARQVSSFTAMPTSRLEAGAEALKRLEKARAKAQHETQRAEEEGVKLKKIKRSPKGMRG